MQGGGGARGQPIQAAHLSGSQYNGGGGGGPQATQGGGRPGTRGGVGPPPGTGVHRLGTAGQRLDPNHVVGTGGAPAELQLDHRPVTQQGLRGMTARQSGPGRQIGDKGYFLNVLRQKLAAIQTANGDMTQEIQRRQQAHQLHTKLSRTHKTLAAEVASISEEFADYTMALDKFTGNSSVAQITSEHQRLKTENDRERRLVDDEFLRYKSTEQQVTEVRKKMDAIYDGVSERMRAAGGDVLADEYTQLLAEHREVQATTDERAAVLRGLDERASAARQKLKSGEFRTHQKGLDLLERRRTLLARRTQVLAEVNSDKSPDEMREALLATVTRTNATIAGVEQSITGLERQLDAYQTEISDKERELQDARRHRAKSAKFDAVVERDVKMTEFIARFPEQLRVDSERKRALQQETTALLSHIARGLARSEATPTAGALSAMKQELAFKETKVRDSEQTLKRLNVDLEARRAELAKINDLDRTLPNELAELRRKTQEMKREMVTFKNIDELRREHEQRKRALGWQQRYFEEASEHLKRQIGVRSKRFEQEKQSLANDAQWKTLDLLQQKLRSYAQTVYVLSEYVDGKQRASDYGSLKIAVAALTANINTILKQRLQ